MTDMNATSKYVQPYCGVVFTLESFKSYGFAFDHTIAQFIYNGTQYVLLTFERIYHVNEDFVL